jgi:hypothetical protein
MKIVYRVTYFLLLMATLFAACGKKSSGGGGTTPTPPAPPPPPTETPLSITTDPDPGSNTVTATGTTYQFNVVILSALPASGVEIVVEYRREGDNSVLFSQTLTTSSSTTPITINNIPAGAVGTVSVKVTSRSQATNTVTKSFRLVRK